MYQTVRISSREEEQKMRIAICDDEREIVEQMYRYISAMQLKTIAKLEVCLFWDAEDFIYEVEESEPYGIVFLDIQIGHHNGINIAKKIREKHPATLIIFMTGFYQYVYDVFQVQPFEFIRKPLQKKDVERVFLSALNQYDDMPVLEYCSNGCVHRVYLKNIFYLMSEGRKVIIKQASGEKIFYGRLDEVDRSLGEKSCNFFRISKSVIINIKCIKEINFCTVILDVNGRYEKFNISRKYQDQVRKRYMDIVLR